MHTSISNPALSSSSSSSSLIDYPIVTPPTKSSGKTEGLGNPAANQTSGVGIETRAVTRAPKEFDVETFNSVIFDDSGPHGLGGEAGGYGYSC